MKRTALVIGCLFAIVLIAAIGFIWFGPVAISDKKVLLNMVLGRSVDPPSPELVRTQLRLPADFRLDLFASDIGGARWLQPTVDGDLLVSIPRTGQIIWLERDRNGDGHSDSRRILIDGLNKPQGMDIDNNNWLYVGETDAVGRVRLDSSQSKLDSPFERIVTGLTGDGNHWTKTVRIGPDGYLYVSQGSTCNVCIEPDPRRAAIMRFRADGRDGQIIATGLRNSEGLDWSPWDNVLYATDNGRDLLGEDLPVEELNRIQPGGFYGWPFVHGFDTIDPQFGQENPERIAQSIAPVHGFHAHNAPLGLRFLRKPSPGYERSALVALHGSWNRAIPDGYKVVSLHWNADGKIEQRDFLTGFLTPKGPIGRPVDVTEDKDGAIYVSDDYGGTIYRVTRTQLTATASPEKN